MDCQIRPTSSRVCEKGTIGCEIRHSTWYWRIWWWFGYHGIYQINWWMKKHNIWYVSDDFIFGG